MKKAKVVIGANFGDEGKGLITDFFAAENGNDTVVVRFNGGAQAGHTVTTPDGRRHVFSHISSGAFAGAETFLSRYFVCNPLLFLKEMAILREKTAMPAVHVDLSAAVTTPYDMMINQIVEDFRGDKRHGSCGMGFGETIERNLYAAYKVTYADLFDAATLRKRLIAIRDEWVPARLARLGVTALPGEWPERIASARIVDRFIDDVTVFLDLTRAATSSFLAKTRRSIVFEGAQGLLLDQERGFFPHVTRSHTGIRNVLSIAEDSGIESLTVAYATRAYLTRHGAGPLPGEINGIPYARVRDETNVKNAYQGSLRFAHLDVDLLAKAIRDDLSDNASNIRLEYGVAVTCMDQLDEDAFVVSGGRVRTRTKGSLIADIGSQTGADFMLTSWGPTREDVMNAGFIRGRAFYRSLTSGVSA